MRRKRSGASPVGRREVARVSARGIDSERIADRGCGLVSDRELPGDGRSTRGSEEDRLSEAEFLAAAHRKFGGRGLRDRLIALRRARLLGPSGGARAWGKTPG